MAENWLSRASCVSARMAVVWIPTGTGMLTGDSKSQTTILRKSSLALQPSGTVPNVNIVGKINDHFRKTVITTVITANTQCRIVVTNRNYGRDDS